jgi:citrate synthase
MPTYLNAATAAARLGVTRATLYAYVSRGLVRSRAEHGRASHEYMAADVELLLQKKSGRRDPARVASQALGMTGLPVLSSELTLIDAGRLYYRGRDALELSQTSRFEAVASLLWEGPCQFGPAPLGPSASDRKRWQRLPFAAQSQCYLAQAEARDPGAHDLTPDAVRSSGARILGGLTALASGTTEPLVSVSGALARTWGLSRARVRALEATLILCADHELNVSAFTARAVASAEATPYMALSAALAALSGHLHGGHTARVAALLDAPGDPAELLRQRVRAGERVPGFGHVLYPDGDPRARRLLEMCPRNAAYARCTAFVEAARRELGLAPVLDFGLVALARALALPPSAPFILFALGRSAGWVAHCLEQYKHGDLIRPRARYVGPSPSPRGE